MAQILEIFEQLPWYAWVLLILWVLPWKGVALWRAARNSDKKWFIILVAVNTFAILEIAYIFFFSKKKA